MCDHQLVGSLYISLSSILFLLFFLFFVVVVVCVVCVNFFNFFINATSADSFVFVDIHHLLPW